MSAGTGRPGTALPATTARPQLRDSAPDERFDRLTRLAARLTAARAAFIVVNEAPGIWRCLSRYGLSSHTLERALELCANVIAADRPLLIAAGDVAPPAGQVEAVPGMEPGLWALHAVSAGAGTRRAVLGVAAEPERRATSEDLRSLADLAGIVGRELAQDARADGRPILARAPTSPVPTTLASACGSCSTARELTRSNAELEQFAHAISHDLRAPLRAIAQLASWLQDDEAPRLSEDGRNHLALIGQRAARMDRLLVDLIEYSRVHREADRAPVETGGVLREIAELFADQAGFRIEVARALPALSGSRVQVTRLFQNLIDNAIKHHDRPTGVIRVAARENDRAFEFEVCDDGPGIPEVHRERVFEMFQTLRPRDEREGSGMGLALAKRIVDAAGGHIWIVPSAPRGTTVRFTWPKRAARPAPESAPA